MSRSASFFRSARALSSDAAYPSLAGILIALLGLSAWMAWAVYARVGRYEVTDSARLEIDRAASPVQARIAGRAARVHLTLGQQVHPGDVLVELESDSERLALAEETTRFRALGPQLDALQAQTGVQDQGRKEERTVLSVASEEARAKYRDAQAQWRQAEANLERASRLKKEGLIALAEFERFDAEAQSKKAAAENLQLAVTRLEPELRVRETDRDARSQVILSDLSKLQAQLATSAATMKRLEYEIERRRIRAPVAGRLAECAVLRPGAYVAEGEKLGLILPGGQLRVVADFLPAAALGRLHPGQAATLRLQGFPWAQYGTIPATVSQVADEIRDGHVRVELAVDPRLRTPIPLQHGLPGSVEIEVERISPAALAMRTAGQLAAAHQ